jgi:hypothetical protein
MMNETTVPHANPAPPIPAFVSADSYASHTVLSVRVVDVTLHAEIVVTCEVARANRGRAGDTLTAFVVFPEDVRGLFELVSWVGVGGVVSAVTWVAVDYVELALAPAIEIDVPRFDRRCERGATARLDLSTEYVRTALTALAEGAESHPRHRL